MKNSFFPSLLLIAVISLMMFLPACASNEITVSLGEEFTLPAGETASIEGEELSVKFEEVTSDSRCPSDVVCVQAGEAKCDMIFTYQGQSYPLTLNAAGGTDENNIIFTDYTIDFNLQPYPVSTRQIAPEDYKLVMTISK